MIPRWQDFFDIAIITGLIFIVLTVIRRSRSQTAMRGLTNLALAVIVLYGVARLFELTTTTVVFERLWVAIVLMFLIVFQNEFRRALLDLGKVGLIGKLLGQSGNMVEPIVDAVQQMSEEKTGALLVIERRESVMKLLGNELGSNAGTRIDASLTSELLRALFGLYSPLHDGAVVISRDRVVAAGCILPLVEAEKVADDLGTRHRAALGISAKVEDAVAVVVSEESGIISIAVKGTLERHHTAESLRERLEDLLYDRPDEDKDAETTKTT